MERTPCAAACAATFSVTNAVYPGGVSVSNPLVLVSVNGPQVTVIDGGGAMRWLYLTDSAVMVGFTLTNGYNGDCGAGISTTLAAFDS